MASTYLHHRPPSIGTLLFPSRWARPSNISWVCSKGRKGALRHAGNAPATLKRLRGSDMTFDHFPKLTEMARRWNGKRFYSPERCHVWERLDCRKRKARVLQSVCSPVCADQAVNGLVNVTCLDVPLEVRSPSNSMGPVPYGCG